MSLKKQLILDEEDDDDEDEVSMVLPPAAKKARLMKDKETPEEIEERMDVIKQKIVQRKATKHKNPLSTKADRKRAKEELNQKRQKLKQIKNMVVNERIIKSKQNKIKEDPDNQQQNKVYNKEGKLFFSKVEIDGEDKKKKKKGIDTNPVNNLKKLKKQKSKIKELIESGDKTKAKEEKQKMLWKAAFDKTEGIKVKDNEEILKKTIKNRKQIKKKSKEKWSERKKKLEEKQSAHNKKREQNLDKRKADNKKTKLKKAVKKGRVF